MKVPSTLLLLILLFSGSLGAQPKIVESDVEVGQLTSDPQNKGVDVAKARTSAEVETIFKSMVDGFRSACCPHQEMRDPQCPCHDQQTEMLRFLIMKGYSQDEVRQFMIHGGPAANRDEYIAYLKSAGFGPINEFMARSFKLKGGLEGPGWDKGWTTLIEETPRDSASWTLVVILGAFVLIAFGVGAVMLKRNRSGLSAEEIEKRDAVEISDEMRAKIERQVKALDDDE